MSSLKEVYDRFTAKPNVDDVYDDGATLSYISSGTNVTGANDIVQFILRARNDVDITEKVLTYHVGQGSLSVEVAAEIKFKNGPSWIVPGVDGNMIDGVVVKLPLVKTVVFTGGRIRSIRVYWDQATVLKQLEIVGARGRGWPITDGSTQIQLVNNTLVVPEQPAKVQQEKPAPVSKPKIDAAENLQGKTTSTPSRRTYSITNDIEIDAISTPRLPRIGWQNNRQHFSLTEEADVSVKEQSPVRLPRVGQAPRREFSFSNLHEAAKSQEPATRKLKQPTTYELISGDADEVAKQAPISTLHEVAEEETPKPKPRAPNSRLQHETIFHDADTTPEPPKKPSIGGGVGGVRPEETIFVELAEDTNPFIQPRKTTVRRDQETHFSFNDESPPSTPIPRNKHSNFQHFSIEGTPDPHEAEYRARALQKKEVNHFRPDTIPNFEFVDKPVAPVVDGKRENSDSMNKLLQGIGRSWNMGSDSPAPAKEYSRAGVPKKGLTPHFSFGGSPEKREEEKENGRGGGGQAQPTTKRIHLPVKSEEKEWWEN